MPASNITVRNGIAEREAFLDAMAAAPTAVTVVTTSGPAGTFAQTVSAFASVSADPPTLLVCVNRRSPLDRALRENGVFTVSLLRPSQASIAETFAGRPTPGRDPYDVNGTEWMHGVSDVPAVAGAAASFECRLTSAVDAATHSVFLGSVTASRRTPGLVGLAHCDRRYQLVH